MVAGDQTVDAYPRILYTGNCRILEKDLRRLTPLYYDKQGCLPKIFTKVYVDTTYCIPEVEELPARGDVIFSLIRQIKQLILLNPDMRIEFLTPGKSILILTQLTKGVNLFHCQ